MKALEVIAPLKRQPKWLKHSAISSHLLWWAATILLSMPTLIYCRVALNHGISYEESRPVSGKNQISLPILTWLTTFDYLVSWKSGYLNFVGRYPQFACSMQPVPLTVENLCDYPHPQKKGTWCHSAHYRPICTSLRPLELRNVW